MKRLLDLCLSLAALAVLGPPILLLGLLARLDSPGPALFRQVRIGRGGRPFVILKIRTLRHGPARTGPDPGVEERDPRISRLGAFLRRWSLDELPQLVNVLKVEMSLVGPRPDLPEHVRDYTPHQRARLEVRPGISGWAQVHGRNTLSWSERIELDLWYVENRSILLDLYIICRTVGVILRGTGVYEPDAPAREVVVG